VAATQAATPAKAWTTSTAQTIAKSRVNRDRLKKPQNRPKTCWMNFEPKLYLCFVDINLGLKGSF
jgi:hypothetical protein